MNYQNQIQIYKNQLNGVVVCMFNIFSIPGAQKPQIKKSPTEDITQTAQYALMTSKVNEKIWPDVFQNSGATYVLDNITGFYYHALSKFYYEPKYDIVYLIYISIMIQQLDIIINIISH